MTQTRAIKIVKKTIRESFEVYSQNSTWEPIVSTREQLNYVLDALRKDNNREKLKDLSIGIYAVREFETEKENFASMIYEVVEIVSLMKKGKL